MKRNIAKALLYAVSLVWLINSKMPAAYFAALAVMLTSFFGMKGFANNFRLASAAAMLVYTVIIQLAFGAYLKYPVIAAIVMLLSSFAVLALFWMLSHGGNASEGNKTSPQKIFVMAAKLGSAILLGVGAWYLLKAGLNLASMLVYALCFVQLFFVFKYEKTAAGTEAAPAAAVAPVKNTEMDSLYSLCSVLVLSVKAFYSFTGGNLKEPLIYFVIAAFIAGLLMETGGTGSESKEDGKDRRLAAWDYILMAAFFAAAFLLRLIWLEFPGVSGDDPYIIIHAKLALMGNKEVFTSDPTIIGPTMIFWMIKSLIVFTGGKINIITARLLAVIMGSLSVVFMYLLAFELFKRRAAIIAAVITSVLFIHVLYSRQTIWHIEVLTFSAMAFYYFMKGIRKGGAINWILAGVGMGLGLYFYNAAKFVPIISVIFLLLHVLINGDRKKVFLNILPGFSLMTLTAVIVYYPILEVAFLYPNAYFSRISYAAAFQQTPGIMQFIQVTVNQLIFTLKTLFYYNFDTSGLLSIPSKEIIDPLNTYLFILGSIAALFQWRKRENLLLILWFLIGMLPSIFSWSYSAGGLRSILTVPAMIVLMASGMEFMLAQFEKISGRVMKVVSPVVIIIVLTFVCYRNINDYFNVYMNDPNVKIRWYNYLTKMGINSAKYKNTNILNTPYYFSERFTGLYLHLEMFNASTSLIDTSRLGFDSIYNGLGKNVLILAEAMNERNVEAYKEFFPNAEIRVYYNYEYKLLNNPGKAILGLYGWKDPMAGLQYSSLERGVVVYDIDANSKPYIDYVSCYIPYEDIKNLYGFKAKYYNANVLTAEERTSGLIKAPEARFDRIELEGAIDAKNYGPYSFACDGAQIEAIMVEGKRVKANDTVMIKGLNRVSIKLSGINNNEIRVKWKYRTAGEYTVVDYKDVIQSDKKLGLLCRKKCETGEYLMRSYFMHHRDYWYHNTAEPCGLLDREWSGYLNIDEANDYRVIFKSAYEAEVFVDGRKACTTVKSVYDAPEIRLSRGRHRILIREKNYKVYNMDSIQLLLQKRGDNIPTEVPPGQLSY